jgi:hypothetical protein
MDLLRNGRGRRNGGLWQGTSAVLLREIPQFAVYYPSYDYSKRNYYLITIDLLMVLLCPCTG